MQDTDHNERTAERMIRRDARVNRQLLLEVAKRLFTQQGVAVTTMKQIRLKEQKKRRRPCHSLRYVSRLPA